jgi:SsrA-binding protein
MAKAKEADKGAPKRIENRRARFDYAIEDTLEAGVMLVGSEVKSIFNGKANLTDAYCQVKESEMWLLNLDVEPYDKASNFQHERRRDRKLLLHRKEIDTLARKVQEKGFALLPLALYFKNGKVKVLIGLGRGKAQYDKRHAIAKDETRREQERLRSGKL